jgi:hypothetical protein
MEEEFYATMKLTSGEEIIAKVSYDPNDDVVIIHNPRVVEKIEMKKRGMIMEGIVFDDWINASYEDMFIIPRSQIITMVEVEKVFVGFYEDHLKDKSLYRKSRSPKPKSNSKRQNPKSQEGFLGSIKEAKGFLEDIYNES